MHIYRFLIVISLLHNRPYHLQAADEDYWAIFSDPDSPLQTLNDKPIPDIAEQTLERYQPTSIPTWLLRSTTIPDELLTATLHAVREKLYASPANKKS